MPLIHIDAVPGRDTIHVLLIVDRNTPCLIMAFDYASIMITELRIQTEVSERYTDVWSHVLSNYYVRQRILKPGT